MGKWFCQVRNGGLGNFVMATPALQLLYKKTNRKVDVFFCNKQIQYLYQKCYFINILQTKPTGKYFCSSQRPRRKKNESDIQALCRIILGEKYIHIPNSYVDPIQNNILQKETGKIYIAVFHGCLGKGLLNKKDVGTKSRQYIIDCLLSKGMVPVVLGSASDNKRFWRQNNLENKHIKNYLGKLSLYDSVGILNSCHGFISNDTGLYHVGAALNKTGLVLWKKTDFRKNQEISKSITYCRNKEGDYKIYCQAVDSFVSRFVK